MKSIRTKILWSIVLFLVLMPQFSTNIIAMSSFYSGDAVTVFPVKNKNIVLKKEIIRINAVPKDTAWIAKCEFIFFNKSDSEEIVMMGYPDWLYNDFFGDYVYGGKLDKKLEGAISRYIDSKEEIRKMVDEYVEYNYTRAYFKGYKEGILPYIKEAWQVDDLRVAVDNKIIKPTHKPLNIKIKIEKRYDKEFAIRPDAPLGAFVWKVNFKPLETKVIKISFTFGGLNDYGGYQEVSYILKTGALWAGKIGEADIYWNYGDRKVEADRIFPSGYKVENNVIHWHFEDFKPDKDISLFVRYGK